jgi:signal transduction histidine kinase
MASTTTVVGKLPRRSRLPSREPLALRLWEWGTTLPVTGLLVLLVLPRVDEFSSYMPHLSIWVLLVVLVDLVPVPYWGRVCLTMSLPVLLAAGMVFEPWAVGLIAFVASLDPRELRRQVTLGMALFNRSQIALSAVAASAVFHAVGGDVTIWPMALVAGIASLAADASINLLAVVGGRALSASLSPLTVVQKLFGGTGWQFTLGYVCSGLLAILLASSYTYLGNWGLVACLVPVTLARQMFAHGQKLASASAELAAKSRQLIRLSERIAEERADERKRIAASLHDDVLPPLYKVHLLANVLRQDIDTGRLLDLDEDIPEVVRTVETATTEVRRLIGNLRRSALGAGGLVSTLGLLMDDLSLETEASIHEDLADVQASPLIQLLIYQVAREALLNAVKHSSARNVWVELGGDGSSARLSVRDDGDGFSTEDAVSDSHFGLQMMRERAEAAGGLLHIRSAPGLGTQVTAKFPTQFELDSG